MTKNQLLVIRCLLARPNGVLTTYEIARKTGVVEKQLGGVLSAMSRKRVGEMALVLPMGRDEQAIRRWKLSNKAITIALADKQVRVLLSSYK